MTDSRDRIDRMAELIGLIAAGKATGYDIAELHLLQRLRVRALSGKRSEKSVYIQQGAEK